MYGRFAPWTFRTTLDISPHRRFAHRLSPHDHGAKRIWANCPWGEMSSAGRNVCGANRPWGKMSSAGRNVCGANRPWGKMSIHMGETFMERTVRGAKNPDTQLTTSLEATSQLCSPFISVIYSRLTILLQSISNLLS